MADSSVAVTPGSGATVDTRTQSGGDHRQVVVIGDPTSAAVGPVDAAGLWMRPGTAAGAALTNVTAATSSTTLLAANTARVGVIVFNDSTAELSVKYGSGASATSFTVRIAAGGYWEMPPMPVYTGLIAGIWSAVNGAARVTELT